MQKYFRFFLCSLLIYPPPLANAGFEFQRSKFVKRFDARGEIPGRSKPIRINIGTYDNSTLRIYALAT